MKYLLSLHISTTKISPAAYACANFKELHRVGREGRKNKGRGEGEKKHRTMLLREYNVGPGKNLSNIKNNEH